VEKIRLNVLLLQGSVKALSYRTVKGGICFHVEQFVEFRGWDLLHDVQVVLSKSRLVELSGEQVMHLPYLLETDQDSPSEEDFSLFPAIGDVHLDQIFGHDVNGSRQQMHVGQVRVDSGRTAVLQDSTFR